MHTSFLFLSNFEFQSTGVTLKIRLKVTISQLSMKFSLLINMKLPTNLGIFIFISTENFHTQLN